MLICKIVYPVQDDPKIINMHFLLTVLHVFLKRTLLNITQFFRFVSLFPLNTGV